MRAEDYRGDKTRPFTGAEYLESLRDGREVYINGERIADVTTHPSMRNSARSIARMYDALHDEKTKDRLTSPTDTGNGGYTHKYFRVAKSSAELVAQQGAIADWARMSYGWMGRTADYKAALMNTLGANADWYGPFKENALAWHKRSQESVLFMNHAIVNPPIDRHKPADAVKDVFVHITKETDAGIYVSGAKVVATSSALTHYNFLAQSSATVTEDPSLSVMFIVPMNAPGIKMFCRVSYEQTANTVGHPFDYPLSSRFDENDAILVLDNVFVPWEDVLVLRDAAKILSFHPASGFMHGYCFQGCTRFAVKLDFIAGLLAKALRATGGDAFRGNQAALGEVIALRHMFWSFSNAMAYNPQPWANGAVLPNMEAALSYRTFMSEAYPRVIETVRKVVASGLIYLPSSAKDFGNPEIDRYLAQYVRGSNDMGHVERIKIMKLLWDATGTEFGGRHALYELNSSSSIRHQFSNAINVKVSQFGTEFIRNFKQNVRVDDDTPEIGFHEAGYLFLADDERGEQVLRRNHETQVSCGAEVSLLDPEGLGKRFPWLNLEGLTLGSTGERGEGWFDSVGLLQGFRKKARSLGAEYIEDEVVAVNREGDRIVSVTTKGGQTIACGTMVNTSGTNGKKVARMAGLDVPVEPRRRSLFVVDCRTPLEGKVGLTIDPTGVFFRPEGKFYLMGTYPKHDPEVDPNDFDVMHDEFEEEIWPTLANRVPAFEAIKVVNSWAGHYDYCTLDHNVVLGPHTEVRNFLFANGFSGHGLQQSPAMGRGLSELITYGGFKTLDLSPFGYERVAADRPFLEDAVI